MSVLHHFASALLDPGLPPPASLCSHDGQVARRFAVHRNNVTVSLCDALAAVFPVVQAQVGEEFFRALARCYLRAEPPRSPILAHYGAGFAAFVAAFAPARALPYLADVARLEWAQLEALHAADAAPLPAAQWPALLQGVAEGGLRLRPHPSARWLDSPHPVFSLWAAHQGQGALEDVPPDRAESALVVRPALEVLTVACDRGTVRLLAGLAAGEAVADACAAAAQAGAFDPVAALALLLRHGAVLPLELAA
jgi:hypothetical protein